jgi:hypothetical protein
MAEGELDAEMVVIAKAIIAQRRRFGLAGALPTLVLPIRSDSGAGGEPCRHRRGGDHDRDL